MEEKTPSSPRDPPKLPSPPSWLILSTYEPECFWAPLQRQMSTPFAAALSQGAITKDTKCPKSYDNRAQAGAERSKSDSVLVSRQRTSYTACERQLPRSPVGGRMIYTPGIDAMTQANQSDKHDTDLWSSRRPLLTLQRKRNVRAASSSPPHTGSRHSTPDIASTSVSDPARVSQEPDEDRPHKAGLPPKSSIRHIVNFRTIPVESTVASSIVEEHHRPTCLLRFRRTKSELAGPTLTMMGAHVAPASKSEVNFLPHDSDLDTTSPSMQIMSLIDDRRGILWADNPIEDNEEASCKISVANWALQTLRWTRRSNSEHVNPKLSEWAWSMDPELECTVHRGVFSALDEGYTHSITSAAENDDNGTRVPFNSQGMSSDPSGLSSIPNTARSSRSLSQPRPESTDQLRIDQSHDTAERLVALPVVPQHEAALGVMTALPYKLKESLADRRLSNMDDSEVKFRGHRDSITIARSRLMHKGDTSHASLQVQEPSPIAKRRINFPMRRNSEEAIARAGSASDIIP